MGLETSAIIAIGAAVAAAGAGTASAVSSYKSSKKANETNVNLQNETNALNYKMFQEQLGFTERMQDKQNAYNTPVEQRERYEQAGINPYLAMGNITPGNSELASTPSPNAAVAPQVQPANNQILASLLNGLGMSSSRAMEYMQMSEQLNAQKEAVKLARIERQYKSQEKIANLNKTIQETENLIKSGKLTDAEASESRARVNRMKYEVDSLRLQNEFDRRTMRARSRKEENTANLIAAQEQGQLLQNAYQQLTNDAFPALNARQLELLASQSYQAVMAGHMSKEGASLNRAMTERELIKKIGDVIDNGVKANQFKLSDLGLTSAELQALRDGKIVENLKQSAISNWLDNIFYYTKTTLPSVPIGFFKGIK